MRAFILIACFLVAFIVIMVIVRNIMRERTRLKIQENPTFEERRDELAAYYVAGELTDDEFEREMAKIARAEEEARN